MLHSACQIALRLLSTLIVGSTCGFEASEIACHDMFALGVMIERERALLRSRFVSHKMVPNRKEDGTYGVGLKCFCCPPGEPNVLIVE
jgi:hypothetical protein